MMSAASTTGHVVTLLAFLFYCAIVLGICGKYCIVRKQRRYLIGPKSIRQHGKDPKHTAKGIRD